MSVYRPILKKAWKITKENKFLWIFGFFITILTSGGEFNLLISKLSNLSNETVSFFFKNLYHFQFLKTPNTFLRTYLSLPPYSFIIYTILSLVIIFLLLLLSVSSQGAIIKATKQIDKEEKVGIKNAFKEGKKLFWPMLGSNILGRILIYSILLIISLPFIFILIKTKTLLYLCFIIYIVLTVILSFIIRFSYCYVVLENKNPIQALKSAISLFFKNWVVSLEMAFIIFLITILTGFIIILSIILALLPLFLIYLIFQSLNFSFGLNLITPLAILIFIFIFITLISFLTTFQYSSWVLLFMRLVKEKVPSKISRTFKLG